MSLLQLGLSPREAKQKPDLVISSLDNILTNLTFVLEIFRGSSDMVDVGYFDISFLHFAGDPPESIKIDITILDESGFYRVCRVRPLQLQ